MEFPVTPRLDFTAVAGCGAMVRGDDGREFVDFYGGHAVACLGYGHPALTQAISAQAEKLVFQSGATDLEVRRRACDALAAVTPAGMDAVFLVNSGAEANESALRLAFWATGRSRVVALKGAFHGRTAAAAAVTYGSEAWSAFPSRPFPVTWVDPGDVSGLDGALGEDVAAFIFEPVQGVAGAVDIDHGFVREARRMTADRGVFMIADEVQTGIGRTGAWFGCEQAEIVPDLLTVAKGLGGGFPVSALVGTSELAARVPFGFLGTTFGGGPMACAAMLAVLQEVGRPGFLDHVCHVSERLRQECVGGVVDRVSGRGLLLGLHCKRAAKEIRGELFEKGVLTGDAKDPNVVRLLPPLVVDDGAVDFLVSALKELQV
ncbi:MAG: aspartate aminotransferase family protein [Armatimonadetes bacterium]|nr:aspartate aminotransferase family protein [Armatimonadota bacterium]